MRVWSVLIAAGVALLVGASPRAQTEQTSRVYTAEVDGIIHPVAAEYVAEVIAKADAEKAALADAHSWFLTRLATLGQSPPPTAAPG